MRNRDQIGDFYLGSQGSLVTFAQQYSQYLASLMRDLDYTDLEKLVAIFLLARDQGAHIFFAGNGGSAAAAAHFAEDLALCSGGTEGKPFRTISLSESAPYLTALGNDRGYAQVFRGQLVNLFRAGDVLVVISASGNSPNILEAVHYVNRHQGVTVGLLGFDGGEAKKACSHSIVVKTDPGEYGPVESAHLAIIHIIDNFLFYRLKANPD